MSYNLLQTGIQYLKGVGPKRAEMLQKELGITTFRDLLYTFPFKYIDRSRFFKISEIDADASYVQIKGKIIGMELAGVRPKQRLIALLADESGIIELLWFKGHAYMIKNLQQGEEYVVFGKPSVFNTRLNMVHPEIEKASRQEQKTSFALQPYYSTTEKMKNNFINSKVIHGLMNELFSQLTATEVEETLPDYLLEKHRLLPLYDALFNIHFPQTQELLKKAEFRLKFDELFYIQLDRVGAKVHRLNHSNGFVFEKVGDSFNNFYHKNLKFELTGAQKKVTREMRKDMATGHQMNRLLQGDVGSGKTLVALMNMLLALDNGYQACLMAPTEILANQHLTGISAQLEGLTLTVALLTGSVKGKKRKEILEKLKNGDIDILIGTHALIEDTVVFSNLGLVIIDEQHRFGVAQRARLWKKNECIPHVLVMTATPIPRTLAMTLYGDLDVSIIDELPPGRKPITTRHFLDIGRQKVFDLMRDEIAKGRQVYVVFPLIRESEKLDLKNLEDGFKIICKIFPAPKYQVCMVHGRMKPAEKAAAMEGFVKGETNILVATTVIEVGVNVANATVMVIESAERFGLAQLHQLRGRVGRGGDQSYCLLISSVKLSHESRKRMEIMTGTTDGFIIAEEDLKMRGQGDLEGTQQSGDPISLKIASLGKDGTILQFARDVADDIMTEDPDLIDPKNLALKNTLMRIKKEKTSWRLIS